MRSQHVLACLLLNVTKAGANRILHIKVDPRKRGTDLMVTIGHELSHALELLRNPGVVDGRSARLFFDLNAPTERLAFETTNAIKIEWQASQALGIASWTASLFQIVTLHELDPDAAGSFDERETHRGAAW